jgi:hypothetical protein
MYVALVISVPLRMGGETMMKSKPVQVAIRNSHLPRNRMTEEERLIFRDVVLSVIVRNRSQHEHVSNSEWLPRQSRLNLQIKRHCECIWKNKLMIILFQF